MFASVFGDIFKITMADFKEQWVCVRFWFMLGKTAAETVTMLKEAFEDEDMGKTKVQVV